MKTVIGTGKSIEEAIEKALVELDAQRDQVETKILELPSKGVMGIFGAKDAKVEVTKKDDFVEATVRLLEDLTKEFGMESTVKAEKKERDLFVTIEGDSMGILIGRRGQTLDAIQYLASLVANKQSEEHVRVIVDTENYRQKREETLQDLARKLAKKVLKNGRKVVLEPMNPYERRVIHSTLQTHSDVYTYSQGEEPFRKVVIDKKKTS
ncbi:MAG TPA: protein jag [Eubacteriaceae bacterium]|nr:protein jag [Eubacteriaceae bacterium]